MLVCPTGARLWRLCYRFAGREEMIFVGSYPATSAPKAEWMIHDLVLPHIGSRPIHELTAPEILAVLRRIEARGWLETCHRAK